MTEIQIGGERYPQKVIISVQRDRYTGLSGPRGPELKYLLRLDQRAGRIDFIDPDGEVIRAIYRLKGDTWEVCQSGPGEPPPEKFGTAKGSGQAIAVYRRINAD